VGDPLFFLRFQDLFYRKMVLKDKINQIIEDVAGDLNYDIYDSSVYLKGENSKITVKIDSLSGITHGDCEEYSKELSFRLQEAALLPNFSLEVSSPGLQRKLNKIEDYIRFAGSPVKVIYGSGDNTVVYKGEIKLVNEEKITLKLEKGEIDISFDNIINANLDY